jgi:hypothetical protein
MPRPPKPDADGHAAPKAALRAVERQRRFMGRVDECERRS